MKIIAVNWSLGILLAAGLAGQAPAPTVPGSQPSQSGAIGTASVPSLPDAQDYRGVLMDVNCPAIAIESRSTGISKSTVPAAAATAPASEPGPAPPSGVLNTVTGGVAPARSTATEAANASRSRANDRMMLQPGAPTVDAKYGDCMVKSTTTAYALLVDGKVMTLDDGSNEKIRTKMNSDEWKTLAVDSTGKPKWTTVTMFGAMRNGQLSIDSSQK